MMISVVLSRSCRARFSKAPETFRARKAIFCSSVFKNREVCMSETSCMKGTCVHKKNKSIKQFCNRKALVKRRVIVDDS